MVLERRQLGWMVISMALAVCSSCAPLPHPLAASGLFVVGRFTRKAFVSTGTGSWHEPVVPDEQTPF